MINLYDDLIVNICENLSNRNKIIITMISKKFDKFKYRFMYYENIAIETIFNLSFFDNFKSVTITEIDKKILPKYVTHLTFGHRFNQSIDNYVPKSVTHLIFGSDFDQTICGSIPNSVTHLKFGFNYNQSIEKCIPNSVTHLTFGFNFDKLIEKCIPDSVLYLRLYCRNGYPAKNDFPKNLTHLELVVLDSRYNTCFPSTISHLTLFFITYISLKELMPPSVKHLTLDGQFNRPIDDFIPSSITHLTLGGNFKKSINYVPSSLMRITLSDDYNGTIHDNVKSQVEIVRI
uniref:F-box domain-containing protein n=1 Tax=viral metagenome TaxID=1070528 RepID=A0A6C0C7Z9_9ZZZZ